MSVTLLQMVDQIVDVAGEEHRPHFDDVQVANEAGRHLTNLHNWRWRARPAYAAAFVADQPYVALPTDFGDLLSIVATGTLFNPVEITDLSEINRLRALSSGGDTLRYRAAVVQPTQATATTAPTAARLEVYPTPAANLIAAMSVVYRATWTELASGSAAVANVPPFVESLLLQYCRSFARYYANDDRASLDALDASPMLDAAKRHDGLQQQNLGPLRGGQLDPGDYSSRTPYWTYGGIN